jgi:hypothetical protein
VIEISPFVVVFDQASEAKASSNADWIPYISALIAVAALWFNGARAIRRPRIQVEQGVVQASPPIEGTMIIVTARYRPVEVSQIGVVVLPKRLFQRRRVPEWFNNDDPKRVALTPWRPRLQFNEERSALFPMTLADGESARVYEAIGDDGEVSALDALPADGARFIYVMASGDVYLKREERRWRRSRRKGN